MHTTSGIQRRYTAIARGRTASGSELPGCLARGGATAAVRRAVTVARTGDTTAGDSSHVATLLTWSMVHSPCISGFTYDAHLIVVWVTQSSAHGGLTTFLLRHGY
jgi:hypothetical protein